jgi:DNA-binding protein YbaB
VLDNEAVRSIERMSEFAERLAADMQDLNGRGQDDDEMVTVVCGPGGNLVGIEFDPRSRRLQTYELSAAVLLAAQRAMQAAQEQLNSVMEKLVPGLGGGGLVAQTRERVAEYERVIAEQQEKARRLVADMERR